MRRPQGISNHNGYVKLRIWLGPKKNLDGTVNKPYTKVKGKWNNDNIIEMVKHRDSVRLNFRRGKMPQPDPTPLSMAGACDLFYKRHFVEDPNRSKSSLRTARSILGGFKKFWPNQAVHTIRGQDVDAYLVSLNQMNSAKKNKLAFLRSLFHQLEAWQKRGEINNMLPDYNPAMYAKKLANTTNKRTRYATRVELTMVKAYCEQHDQEMWTHITRAILSGLRKSDQERVQGKVDVIPSKTSRSSGARVVLPLSFTGGKIRNFQSRWERVKEGADLRDFHWHDWRHTSATLLKELGAETEVIKEYLGHTKMETTEGYIHGQEERMKPWVDKLERQLEAI